MLHYSARAAVSPRNAIPQTTPTVQRDAATDISETKIVLLEILRKTQADCTADSSFKAKRKLARHLPLRSRASFQRHRFFAILWPWYRNFNLFLFRELDEANAVKHKSAPFLPGFHPSLRIDSLELHYTSSQTIGLLRR